jgi:fatty-acyl-CoA synthase
MMNFDSLLEKSSKTVDVSALLTDVTKGLQFDDAINIQFTSGTTGHPKGATLSHHNILNNGYFIGETIGLQPGEKVCIPVPLYHCFGMVIGNIACLTHGCTMVYPSEVFDPESALRAVSEEKCAALYGVPTMIIAQLEHPNFKKYDLSSLRTGVLAGSLVPKHVMQRVQSDMHMKECTICYGMTETSPVSTQTGMHDPIEKRVATVGRVHPHVEIKIVDSEDKIVPRGVTGELLTRGYCVMKGYWEDAKRTREAISPDGWMRTGDLAVMDGEGYVSVEGRLKDMVIRGGENIYPKEVEEFLYSHPAVQDVAVIGVDDAKYGEELCACVILRPEFEAKVTTEDIRGYGRGKIAHFKIPKYVQFVDSFPLTVSGKIKKFELRNIMKGKLL